MPYSISNPPDRIKGLPKHAQEIWVAAFNAALKEYDDEGKANATAWAAVKKAGYEQDSKGEWHKRGGSLMDIKELWEKVRGLFEPFVNEADEIPTKRVILPTQTRALTITRDAAGKARWLMIAASAVVNKVGAIDSTILFDNFIKRASETGKYPRLDFLHEGETICFGTADWLRRDAALYLASGTFDDTPLARAAAAGLEVQSDYWGGSIAYKPTVPPMTILAEGQIPVYTDGTNDFISIVPRRMAANLFTAASVTEEVKRMDKTVFDELVKLVGETAAQPFAAMVDEANRTITETGMVTRVDPAPTTQETPTTPPPATEPPAPVEPPTPTEPPAPPVEQRQDLTAVEEKLNVLAERVSKLEQVIAGQTAKEETAEKRSVDTLTALNGRLQTVEKNSQAWADWLAGLPEQQRTEATYRARTAAESAPIDSGDIAKQTTSEMHRDAPRKR